MSHKDVTRQEAIKEVLRAINKLKSANGSSVRDICKVVKEHRNIQDHTIRDALRIARQQNQLEFRKNRFFLPGKLPNTRMSRSRFENNRSSKSKLKLTKDNSRIKCKLKKRKRKVRKRPVPRNIQKFMCTRCSSITLLPVDDSIPSIQEDNENFANNPTSNNMTCDSSSEHPSVFELETQIEQLRDTQRKYSNILRLSRALASHFYHVVQTQHALGEAFSDLAQKSPELQEEFLYNSETQRNLTKNGETLLNALNFFVSSVNTLCNKTIEDTLLTIRQYETARIEYDAYRTDLELLIQSPRSENTTQRLEEAQISFDKHKDEFEKLRSDVIVKLKFLDENRIKVMHKQLLLFHNAISAYFSGNQQALEATLKQFNIKVPES